MRSSPDIVVELKWDRPVDEALEQPKERRYAEALDGLDAVLLVCATYGAKTKEHSCRIELWEG